MTTRSRIEWTEHTWNPVTGCSKLSPGCAFCYAEVFALRLQAMGVTGYESGFAVTTHQNRLSQPLTRQKPTRYFVNSMSDLFHETVPDEFIQQVFDIMEEAHWHRFQILTKRPARMAKFAAVRQLPSNIWLGVSVENRRHGLPRIATLREIDAAVRFLSIEPLLEDLGEFDLQGIHWVILGGESGARARAMKPEWARRIRDQCLTAGVRFFFKQWGSVGPDGKRQSKAANGHHLDGRVWQDFPDEPDVKKRQVFLDTGSRTATA